MKLLFFSATVCIYLVVIGYNQLQPTVDIVH